MFVPYALIAIGAILVGLLLCRQKEPDQKTPAAMPHCVDGQVVGACRYGERMGETHLMLEAVNGGIRVWDFRFSDADNQKINGRLHQASWETDSKKHGEHIMLQIAGSAVFYVIDRTHAPKLEELYEFLKIQP